MFKATVLAPIVLLYKKKSLDGARIQDHLFFSLRKSCTLSQNPAVVEITTSSYK